ncbi:MAG TPA: DUF3857 domain-containing protein [Chitinophagaceae bacterium]|jgi:hypothetical protein|nr:DUF3857 domain-containing protein [Chitinophagaceae bacterium]
MRKFPLLVAVLLLACSSFAQKKKDTDPNLPPFGTIEKADLELKDCAFDPSAEAMVLVDDGELEYSDNKGLTLKRRIRIKILNNKGLDQANVKLRYHSYKMDESISGLEAHTFNLDASGNVIMTPVDKKQIFEKKLNKRYTEKAFTFPEVKVGSVIEYKFRHEHIGLIDWYFQRSVPVRYSSFVTDFPEELEVTVMPFCSREYSEKKQEKARRVIKTYSMKDVPGLRDESYVINEDYYRDRLETKITAFYINGRRQARTISWPMVIKYLMEDEDFGEQLKRNIPRTADLDAQLKTLASQYDQMKAVYKYVQQNMEWNEYEGIWAFDGVRSAWKDKKGTVGEINLILVNLLKDAGIDARPVLVSTHENGVVNTADAGTLDAPGFHQFNKVMAYVELNGRVYVLDATQKNMPVHLVPTDVMQTQGLVINKLDSENWGWQPLATPDKNASNLVMINGTISAEGKLNGEISITSYDYARIGRLGLAKKGKDKYIEKFVTENNPGLSVEDVKFENLEADSLPLVQKVKFTQPLNTAGEYSYFSTNMLTGLEKNPFVSDNRFSDIFFGCGQAYTIIGNFTLPEGYEFDELPKDVRMRLPDTSIVISRISQKVENRLQTSVRLEFKQPVYGADQYGELQEFYQRLFEILNEQYVVRKKVKP